MSDQTPYTPTTEEVREAIAEWVWSRRMFRPDLGASDGREADRWLAAHDAEVRAEWEEKYNRARSDAGWRENYDRQGGV